MKLYRFILLVVFLGVLTINAKSLRIEASILSENLGKYKIIDTRENSLYIKGHIKGALSFPINLTYEYKKDNGKVAQPAKIQKIIRELGLNTNDNIVIYDDGSFFDAARLFWTLEVYGFTNVKLINGGFEQLLQHKFKTTQVLPQITQSNYIVSVNNKRLATKFTTQIATRNPNQIILDARTSNGYNGETSSAKRYGHIPKAIHFPATNNISYKNKITQLNTTNNLKKLYSKLDKNKKVIVYCAIGRTASTNYFALRELDYDVANYDSSWKEWGDDFNLPIINLAKDL